MQSSSRRLQFNRALDAGPRNQCGRFGAPPLGLNSRLTDILTLTAPAKLKIKRVGQDLMFALPGGDIEMPDVVLRDYFSFSDVSLMGQTGTGEWMLYDTATVGAVSATSTGVATSHRSSLSAKVMRVFEARYVLGAIGFLAMLLTAPAQAQPAPLNLPYLIEQASLNHPSMQSARLDSRASAEDLLAVRRQRWPAISAVIEDGSNTTASSASRALRVEQSLWDAGRSTARIAESEAATDIGQARIYIQQQLLAIQLVNAWQNLLASQAKVVVAQATLTRLQAYRSQMQRRILAEVSPAIDLELVQSRMLQTQVELTNAQTGVKTAITKLEQVSGASGLTAHVAKLPAMPGLDATAQMPALLSNTDWTLAASGHPSVAKARFDYAVAGHRISAKQAEQWPQVYARVDQPIAGSNTKTAAFVGLRYTPGAGFSTLAEAQALSSRAASLAQGAEAALREVLEALHNDRDEFFNTRQRIEALVSATDGSDKVLDSYGRQFTAGRKTWQDLMNAVRELAQNQYALADANAAMTGAMHRLQIRLGQGIATMTETPPK